MSPPSSERTAAITAAPSSTHSPSVPPTVPEVFVPDYRPGKANRAMQNQTGRFTYTAVPGNNFMHEEHFDRQDDWVYVFFRTHQGYKFRFDGKGSPIPLPADIGAENAPVVMGDWIYYLRDDGIRRVRTDGSGAEPFVADAAFFCMDSQTLYYSTEQPVGPYGRQTWQLTVRARSLTGGEDRLLFQDEHAQQVDTRFLLLGDWLYFPGHAYSLDGRHYAFPLTDGYGGQYWIDGSRVYVNDGLRQLSWLDFSGTVPVYTCYADLRYAEGIVDFRCEFLDFEQNRMAVTIQENNFTYFRWMNWDGSVIGDRPQPLQQTRMGHRFHRFEDGWIFAADNDDVPYRCRADGSGYQLYSAL